MHMTERILHMIFTDGPEPPPAKHIQLPLPLEQPIKYFRARSWHLKNGEEYPSYSTESQEIESTEEDSFKSTQSEAISETLNLILE